MNRLGWKVLNRRFIMVGLAALLTMSAAFPKASHANIESGAGNTADASLSGVRSADKSTISQNEAFTLTYELTPSGTVGQRDSVETADVAMVLDVSGSMNNGITKKSKISRMTAVKDAAKLVTKKFRDANFGDRVGLIQFSTSANQLMGLTTDYISIDSRINGLIANGSTNIDHGLRVAQTMLGSNTGTSEKYVILLTDGAANYYYDDVRRRDVSSSSLGRSKAIADAIYFKTNHITVFTVAVATFEANASDIDIPLLQEIAAKGGGKMFQASDMATLNGAFDQITQTIQDPKISNIVLSQKLPPGVIIAADDKSGATVTNGILTKNINNLTYPFTGENLNRTIPVKLQYVGSPGKTITFEDASVGYNVLENQKTLPIKDAIKLRVNDKYVTVKGEVGLKNATPAAGEKVLTHVDIPITYQIEPQGDLLENGPLAMKIVHRFPEGVEVAGGALDAAGRYTLTFNLSSTYSNSVFSPAVLNHDAIIRFTNPKSVPYDFSSDVVYVEYTDNHGVVTQQTLINKLPDFNAVDKPVILVDPLGAYIEGSDFSYTPVTIAITVDNDGGGLQEMAYTIKSDAEYKNDPTPPITSDSDWKPIGAKKFKITKAGENHVYVYVKSTAGFYSDVHEVITKIDYDQKRY